MSGDEFQIVAFSTNETTPTANDILKIFLDQHSHIIKVQSMHTISCEFTLQNDPQPKKLMMASLSDLNRTYEGISDVSFYFVFVHMDYPHVQKNLELIGSYMKKYCDLSKRIFVFSVPIYVQLPELPLAIVINLIKVPPLDSYPLVYSPSYPVSSLSSLYAPDQMLQLLL